MIKLFFVNVLGALVFSLAIAAPASFSYYENYPNNPQTLVFKTDKTCKDTKDFVQIREFYSEKQYTSVDTEKKEPVRIVHIYANLSVRNCKIIETKKIEKTFEIPKSKLMTHVFVTSDPEINVNSLQ